MSEWSPFEENLWEDLTDEGPTQKNMITVNFVDNDNPLVMNKGKARQSIHKSFEKEEDDGEFTFTKKMLNKSFDPTQVSLEINGILREVKRKVDGGREQKLL